MRSIAGFTIFTYFAIIRDPVHLGMYVDWFLKIAGWMDKMESLLQAILFVIGWNIARNVMLQIHKASLRLQLRICASFCSPCYRKDVIALLWENAEEIMRMLPGWRDLILQEGLTGLGTEDVEDNSFKNIAKRDPGRLRQSSHFTEFSNREMTLKRIWRNSTSIRGQWTFTSHPQIRWLRRKIPSHLKWPGCHLMCGCWQSCGPVRGS